MYILFLIISPTTSAANPWQKTKKITFIILPTDKMKAEVQAHTAAKAGQKYIERI